jgi:LemA protein
MKKKFIPSIIIAAFVFWGIYTYNKMVPMKGNPDIAWANVESQYQRRFDLIENLVETVKGYANHEKSTLEAVIKARAEATKTTIDPSNMTPEKIAEFQKAQSGMMGALSKLIVSVERYPELKANQNFLELQSQLEGTENRIQVAIKRYNQSAGEYNIFIAQFPRLIIAKIFGFNPMSLFKSEVGANKRVKVKF